MSAHPQSSRVRIELLGAFRASVKSHAVADTAWPGRRSAELMQLLALADRHRQARDQVIEALWPHLGPDAGAANLRKAAHHGVMLVIDDAHLADDATIEACLHLARAGGGLPFLAVLAFRPVIARPVLAQGVAGLDRAGRSGQVPEAPCGWSRAEARGPRLARAGPR